MDWETEHYYTLIKVCIGSFPCTEVNKFDTELCDLIGPRKYIFSGQTYFIPVLQ